MPEERIFQIIIAVLVAGKYSKGFLGKKARAATCDLNTYRLRDFFIPVGIKIFQISRTLPILVKVSPVTAVPDLRDSVCASGMNAVGIIIEIIRIHRQGKHRQGKRVFG